MAVLEPRGKSVRVNWRLGGGRDGARQSCTFSGPPKARDKFAAAAKQLVESRQHNITRDEVYQAVLGKDVTEDAVVPTFRAWTEMWLTQRAKNGEIQPDTVKKYRWELKARAMPKLGHLRLTDITEDTITDWVHWLNNRRSTRGNRNGHTDEPLSANTIRKAYRIVHACLGAANRTWVPVNPAAKPAGAKVTHHGLPSPAKFDGMFLEPFEIEAILANCDPRITDMLKVFLGTGLRLGELLVLQKQHITTNRSQTVVQVRRTLKDSGEIGKPKSDAGIRAVPVDKDTAAILHTHIAGKRMADLVFPSPSGGVWPPSTFRRYWWQAVAGAQRCPEHPPPLPARRGPGRIPSWGVKDVSDCACSGRLQRHPRIHDLRHTHGSALLQSGWNSKKVQVRLGHSQHSTTMNIYAHLWDLGEVEELEAASALLFPARPALTLVA
ncbi:putative phage integrase [Actinoplanes missouriensis 431]|uniref:Putative phage integrase n=1 Tax=Actinoplanes missouriensis (strain ATCC 14538 / DSM 43046 / CBS 188.64 / JCM 3121 / NBRC 102363 / NCIMB 12654 / NRRL B-3342 / UNCC 431) TaxID=512565 RepID=I0H2D0_ACTM4|nr:site-specific integrase [Actinoplanes missouriensis]BAL87167.1 putative phage integrase [Actinoplanes missouriensis 431]